MYVFYNDYLTALRVNDGIASSTFPYTVPAVDFFVPRTLLFNSSFAFGPDAPGDGIDLSAFRQRCVPSLLLLLLLVLLLDYVTTAAISLPAGELGISPPVHFRFYRTRDCHGEVLVLKAICSWCAFS
jgi:hypothetical protein